jgi:hypothetical protein
MICRNGFSSQKIILSEINSLLYALRTDSKFCSTARFVKFIIIQSNTKFQKVQKIKYFQI